MSYFMRPSFTPSMPQNSVKKSNSTAGVTRLLALEQKKKNGMFAIAHYAHPVAGTDLCAQNCLKPLHNAVLYHLHSFTGAPSQEIVVQLYYHIQLLFPKDVFVDSPTVSRKQNKWEILYITFLTVTLLYIQIELDRLLHNTSCIN